MEYMDACVIGAGVVGLAVAKRLTEEGYSVAVIEKEASFGQGISSRNSEVIHAGIYYPAGSLKAQLCVEGKKLLYKYCESRSIPFSRPGKLIVATNTSEESTLTSIKQRAEVNGVYDLEWLDSVEVKKKEPLLKASAALLSPSTGIINCHDLMMAYLADIERNGGFMVPLTSFQKATVKEQGFIVETLSNGEDFTLECKILINAAGLSATQVASSIDGLVQEQIPSLHYCKGNYFSLSGASPFRHLIYPVPDASGAGLGIHATLDLAGQTRFGPDVEWIEHEDYLVNESRAQLYEDAIKRYFPTLKPANLVPAYSGIRPKLSPQGQPAEDFIIQDENTHHIPGLVQLFGIESPGLTSSLAIADEVLNRVKQ